MRLGTPRLPVLSDEALSGEALSIVAPLRSFGPLGNVFRMLACAPRALAGFLGWGAYIVSRENSLPPGERQMVILRTAFLCKSGYAWTSHANLARKVGVTDDVIERVKRGPHDTGWSSRERAILGAVDAAFRNCSIDDVSWSGVAAHLSERELLDLVLTTAHFTQVAIITNSLGVQLDAGHALDPDLKGQP